jgi:hypothetical protein
MSVTVSEDIVKTIRKMGNARQIIHCTITKARYVPNGRIIVGVLEPKEEQHRLTLQ